MRKWRWVVWTAILLVGTTGAIWYKIQDANKFHPVHDARLI